MRKNLLQAALERAGGKKVTVHMITTKKESKAQASQPKTSYYYPPTLYLGTEDFPGIASWKAGDTVCLAVTAKVKGVSINQPDGGKERHNADLELMSIADMTMMTKAKKAKAK